MAERIRAADWSITSLGPPATWPLCLKTATSMILASHFPACIVWGSDLITIYNDAFRPILGNKPEALGRPFSEVWHEAWHEIGSIAERAMAGESTFIEHFPLIIERHGFPEQAYFTFCYSPIRNESGTIVGFLDTVVETTSEVKSQEAVRKSEERFRALVSASSDVVYRMSPDWREMYHLVGRDFITDTLDPSHTWLENYIHPDDQQHVTAAISEAIRTKSVFELEHRVRRIDGTLGWTFSRAIPLLDEKGEITEWFGTASDVTARRKAEEALRASEARNRQILDSATDYAIIATDLDGRVTQWNRGAEHVLGWAAEEMLGETAERFFTPEDVAADRIVTEMTCALEEGAGTDERWHQRKDGERFWATGEMTPLRDDADQAIGFVKVLRDRTEQRRDEERLRLLFHELNHRVKNILSTVQAIANQAFRGANPEHARAAFEARLFALAKAHDVLTRENWEGAELQTLIAEVVEPYEREKGQRFQVAGPRLRLNPSMALSLSMAVHELATNAAKYGALSVSSGRVRITWTVAPGDPPVLTLHWEEQGGPAVSLPMNKGFGTRLIERSLARELSGEVHLSYEPTGLVCTVNAPLIEETAINR